MIKFIERLARFGVRLSMGVFPESLVSFLIVGTLGMVVHISVLKTVLAIHDTPFKYANLLRLALKKATGSIKVARPGSLSSCDVSHTPYSLIVPTHRAGGTCMFCGNHTE